MSAEAGEYSSSSCSEDELSPLPPRTKTGSAISDGEDRSSSAPRRRRESTGKHELSGGSKTRSFSDRRPPGLRAVSPRRDGNRHRNTDSAEEASLDSSSHSQTAKSSKPLSDSVKADASVLNSTLQSINRIKEEKEIQFEDGTLKGGSLTAIVLRLIEEADRNSSLWFLAALPRYGLPEQLLGLLIDKFKERVQILIDSSDFENDRVVACIFNFFSLWLDNYFYRDFQRTMCLQLTENFLREMSNTGYVEWHRRCTLILLRRVGHEARSPLFITSTGDESKATKKGKRLSTKKRSRANSIADGDACFDSLAAADIAEQLTLREWELFRIIPESEYLDKVWLQRPPPSNSPLVRMIDHFNIVSMWVAEEIVNTEDLKDRVNALKKFLTVCELLFELGNFNGLMEVIAGLSLGCVQRLHKTWSLAGSGPKAVFERFSNIMTTKQNFQSYRHALSATKMPAVPYVGVILRDIVFLEEGNPLKLPNGFFNFDRIQLLGRLMLEITRFKRTAYDIPSLPQVQAFFAKLKSPENDDALYAASLAAEHDNDGASVPS